MIGGANNNPISEVDTMWRYNPAANTWTTLAPLPHAVQNAGAGYANGQIYVAGGYYYSPLSYLQVYDVASDSWSEGPSMPTATNDAAVSVYGNLLYVIGGAGGARNHAGL